ncbi:enoyl-CoA hydratase-related protein [Sphingobium sp.]|uniref:enoyl-CoA hydratase-related protein n=1 Tax=Sphingobium sp. TaxID=1912891 RepID=UPI003B3BC750
MAVSSPIAQLQVEVVHRHVAIVTLHRPQVRNAIDAALAEAIDGVVKQVEADGDIRAVVLSSSQDRVFCAGADLAEIAAGRGDRLMTADGGFAGFVQARRTKPWIAAVRGAAFAGGCELALACDMIVAHDAALFSLPEVKLGVYAGAGGAYRLPARLPRNVAMELLLTGGAIDGGRAFALGMVNRLSAMDAVVDTAVELARAITANGPIAVQESFAVARAASDMLDAQIFPLSERARERVFASADAQEGARAFLEKRPPVWQGR